MRYNDLKSKAHCKFLLVYHVVFVTKFRYRCLSHDILQDLLSVLPKMAEEMLVKITDINGDKDHMHFLLELSPQDTLGNVIGALKAKSSSYLKRKYKFPYFGKHLTTLWSSGYFVVSTGSAPLDIVKNYIQNQRA